MNSSGKRKLQTQVKSREIKVKTIEMKEKVKKVLTKPELVLELKSVQDAFEALKETNIENLKTIASMKERLETFEKETSSMQTQTDMNCNECTFKGINNLDLDWHMKNFHGWASVQESKDMNISLASHAPRVCGKCGYEAEDLYDYDAHTWSEDCKENETPNIEAKQSNGLNCKICEKAFNSKRDLMEHRKKEHTESVNVCWNFSSGKCGYGDEKCWFTHDKISKSIFKCNFCGKTFESQSEFLTHRIQYHRQIVPPCRNLQNGKCPYTNENCWFNHNGNEIMNENENNDAEIEENKEVIQKIFQMMENFTKEIMKMKEINNLQ